MCSLTTGAERNVWQEEHSFVVRTNADILQLQLKDKSGKLVSAPSSFSSYLVFLKMLKMSSENVKFPNKSSAIVPTFADRTQDENGTRVSALSCFYRHFHYNIHTGV